MDPVICKYISYTEATKSANAIAAGIPNKPSADALIAMRAVATVCFVPLREHFGVPIGISSFYRSVEVNALARGSSETSQHCKGEAIDIDADIFSNPKVTNAGIFNFFYKGNITFDQLIWEYGNSKNPDWVHVSYRAKGPNRRQVLCKRAGTGYFAFKP